MPVHQRKNAYRGVNVHLHSHFQQRGDWSAFHSAHIQDLRLALQAALPPDTGYFVLAERYWQDVGVNPGTARYAPTWSFSDYKEVMSVVVYRAGDNGEDLPITRLELLSPVNKPPGSHTAQYLRSRSDMLIGGVNMIEIDYLHERRSPLPGLPDYTKRETGAHPYNITVSVPQPDASTGRMDIYSFRVDAAIPAIKVPLVGEDSITLDFDSAYQTTYTGNPYFGLRLVDYAQLPANFAAYDEEDQRRINARMEQQT